jgi:branched-chain amino acid transport system substrate-binding protein
MEGALNNLIKRLSTVASLGASLLLVVTTSALAELDSKTPFKVGAVISKSGPYSHFGGYGESALLVAVKQVNEAGGILGRKVELIIRDDASNPGRALLAAKELIEEQKVDFLFPEIVSGLVLASLPYATEKKMITITPGASPLIGDASKFPYSFQYGDIATERVPAMVNLMKKLGGKKVGILVSSNPATTALGDVMSADLVSKYGMQLAGYTKFAVETMDLTSQLQSLRDSGADIIAFDSAGKDSIRVVMTSMLTLGWKANVVSEPANIYGDLTEQVPAAVHSQFFSVMHRVAIRSGGQRSGVAEFTKELKAYGPIENIIITAEIRDAIFMAKWAYETAMKERGNASSDSVKSVLETLNSREYPETNSLVLGNPRYKPTDHTTLGVDYSKLWGMIKVSKPIDGAYEGEIIGEK